MAVIKQRSYVSVITFVALIILQCEGREKFYRPDMPEQLCAIGLIDIDDTCLLYTSDAADDLLCVDHGGRRII